MLALQQSEGATTNGAHSTDTNIELLLAVFPGRYHALLRFLFQDKSSTPQ
jgi:hypothetical protein